MIPNSYKKLNEVTQWKKKKNPRIKPIILLQL